MILHVAWQVRDPLLRQGGLMKMSEGGLLLERLHVEEQGGLRDCVALEYALCACHNLAMRMSYTA